MTRRIPARRWRLGGGEGLEPDDIDELEGRRAKHARLIQGKPERSFGDVLKQRMAKEAPDRAEAPAEAAERRGARDPLLGLDPNQNARLANRPAGRRSGRVIVKG